MILKIAKMAAKAQAAKRMQRQQQVDPVEPVGPDPMKEYADDLNKYKAKHGANIKKEIYSAYELQKMGRLALRKAIYKTSTNTKSMSELRKMSKPELIKHYKQSNGIAPVTKKKTGEKDEMYWGEKIMAAEKQLKRAKATKNGGWISMLEKRIAKYEAEIKKVPKQYAKGGNTNHDFEEGDRVTAKKEYGGKSGLIAEIRGSYIIVRHKDKTSGSYHFSDLIKK